MTHPDSEASSTPETSPNSAAPLRIVLASDESAGQITVALPAYVDFNRDLNERLEQLEQQFAAFRTPGMPTGRGKFNVA